MTEIHELITRAQEKVNKDYFDYARKIAEQMKAESKANGDAN